MIKFISIQYLTWLALPGIVVFLMSNCASQASLQAVSEVKFITIKHIPVIQGRINGKRAYFIIDTGASCSILNQSVADRFGFKYFATLEGNVAGFGGSAKVSQAFNCVIEFGPLRIGNVIFHTRHLDDLAAVIQEQEHIDIAGIIGSDIFRRYKIGINYKTNTITF
jgi:hypothetical protein